MITIDPFANPQAWDVVVIGGVASPGLCKVGKFSRGFEWDVKKGKGSFGATVTFIQRPPAKGGLTFYFWLSSHITAWNSFEPLLKYDPTKKAPSAVDIYHPSLADIDLNAVVVEELGNLVHEGNQMYSLEVKLLEYFPPPKISAVSTPSGSANNSAQNAEMAAASAGGVASGQQPDPAILAAQKQFAQLANQAGIP